MDLIVAFVVFSSIAMFAKTLINMYKELSAISEKTPDKKKSYQDEMSIYDDARVDAIQNLPQTGISLDNLIDGELPDAIYQENRK